MIVLLALGILSAAAVVAIGAAICGALALAFWIARCAERAL